MFVRTDVDERGGVSVIRVIEHDQVARFRVRACEPEREFVGFAA